MKRLKTAAFGALLTALVSSGFGCELIASIDRSKIDQVGGGGAGGSPEGGGGTGGLPTGGGGTGGTECVVAADCPAPATECVDVTCEESACVSTPKASGTPVTMQTDGDCKVAQCDGDGGVIDANDDADVPVDGEECTDDVCTDGVPSNPPLAVDTPCGLNGALICDGAGQCIGCIDAEDCGTETECQSFTCDMNVCNTVNAAQGTTLAMQTDGDCQVEQCDGMGGVESAEDNADLPVDGTVCTDDLCTAGMPSNPAAAANSTCMEGTGTLCDGMGACVECNAATDCPGADTECQTRTCAMGVCGFNFAPMGTALMSQTDGDCQDAVCDGTGGVTSADNDTDLPNDNEDCTTDTCVMGEPTFTNVTAGTTCGAMGVCDDAGQCVGCNAPSDCPGTDDECKTRTCSANVCGFSFTAQDTAVAMQTANDCKKNVCDGSGNIVSQNDDTDVPVDDGNECTSQACSMGTPAFPPVALNTPCGGGAMFCDGGTACVECTAASQCPAGANECQTATCNANTCGIGNVNAGTMTPTQTAGDCQVNQCDANGNVVQAVSNGDVPVDGLECTDDVCMAGAPSNPPVAINTPCGPGGAMFCSGGTACVACTMASQCPAGANECQVATCSANTCGIGSVMGGTVTSMQTAGDCKQNVCDGAGGIISANLDTDVPADDGNECTNQACNMGSPAFPPSAAGTSCMQMGGTECDGNGLCIAPGATCSDGMQNGAETGVDCGGPTCPACANGLGCTANSDCQSGICDVGASNTCVQCVSAAQCPAGANECQVATCNANMCGIGNVMSGTATSMQTSGDCKQNVCDGAGGIISANLDTDVPADDGNECTNQACNMGSPVFSPVAAGTPVAMQTSGDCQEVQCDGASGTVSVATDTDLPADDGNECTDEVCTAGAPSHPNLPAGTACNQMGGTECDGMGACVSAPSVASTTPADGAASIASSSTIAVTFTKAMNAATLTAQTAGGACSGSIQVSTDNFASCIGFSTAAPVMSVGDTVATLTPAPALSFGTIYKIKVLASAADTQGLTIGADVTTPTGFATGTDFVSGPGVVISQVYGGGGNGGATYNADFVELHNRGTAVVDIGGWSVQYASSTGNFGNASLKATLPAGVQLQPGQYYLVQMSTASGTNGVALSPDFTASPAINMSGNAGKVALVNSGTTLPVASCVIGDVSVVDLVGFGSQVPATGCWETLPAGGTAPTQSVTTASMRRGAGCVDSGDNSADLQTVTVTPRNTSSPASVCSVSVNEKDVGAELDYCNLQFPTSINVQTGMMTPVVYAQAYEAGATDPVGAATNLVAQVGYGPTTVNPETQSGWTWTAATFNTNVGNNDEWQAQLTAPAAGTYRYTARFSFDGVQWTYCDLNGAGSNAGLSFEVNQLPTMTVTP